VCAVTLSAACTAGEASTQARARLELGGGDVDCTQVLQAIAARRTAAEQTAADAMATRLKPRSGYVDAYEVTVARFRAWMRAGMPRPMNSAVWFNNLVWRDGEFVMPPGAPNSYERAPDAGPTASQCTYSETSGVNDDLPINCITPATAAAFCWWDGMHIVTEAAWEYLARNRGTTATPWGAPFDDARACMYGDVGTFWFCPIAQRPRAVGSSPPGVSRDPAGVYDLYGGVQEYTLGFPRPYNAYPSDGPAPCPALAAGFHDDGRLSGSLVMRGAAWNFGLPDFRAYARSATRGALPQAPPETTEDPRRVRSPRAGIRCARWVPEPR
jgi:formylglycine-generating enzyme required for sulfatase activity